MDAGLRTSRVLPENPRSQNLAGCWELRSPPGEGLGAPWFAAQRRRPSLSPEPPHSPLMSSSPPQRPSAARASAPRSRARLVGILGARGLRAAPRSRSDRVRSPPGAAAPSQRGRPIRKPRRDDVAVAGGQSRSERPRRGGEAPSCGGRRSGGRGGWCRCWHSAAVLEAAGLWGECNQSIVFYIT